jgi:CubicO group peptidase (beta-lactamase class C family)
MAQTVSYIAPIFGGGATMGTGSWATFGVALLLSSGVLTSDLSAQRLEDIDAAWDSVRTAFRQRLNDEGIVGGSLWLLDATGVVRRELVGYADLASGRAIDEQTIFHWASITKTLTGIAVMQLRDRGMLDLDDALVTYLPELEAVFNPFGSMEEVTIRQLLSHSSGFRGPTWPWGGSEPWHPHEPMEWSQLAAMIPYTRIEFAPGSRFGYSNPGIVFLGRIIELLSGDDYEVYIDKNILKPLGMFRSYFDVTPYHLVPFRSNNYFVDGGLPTPNGLDFDTGITVSNGGLNAPIPDMLRYLRWLGGDTTVTEHAAGILTRSSLEEMWIPQVSVPPTPSSGVTESVGLAFFITRLGTIEVIGHTGEQLAFLSFFCVDPATGVAAIAAFNTMGRAGNGPPVPNTRLVRAEMRAHVLGEVFSIFR